MNLVCHALCRLRYAFHKTLCRAVRLPAELALLALWISWLSGTQCADAVEESQGCPQDSGTISQPSRKFQGSRVQADPGEPIQPYNAEGFYDRSVFKGAPHHCKPRSR